MAGFYETTTNFRRPHRNEEDTDPMSSVANISDAMLVFACGLLIAIVLAWNVDLSAVKQVEIDQAQQVEDVESLRDMLASEGSAYIERGTVYQDPYTGQLYMLESTAPDAQGQASATTSAAEGAATSESTGTTSGASNSTASGASEQGSGASGQ